MAWRVMAMAVVGLHAGGRAVPAQQPVATVREVKRTMTTYPYGDPDPVPRVGRIYPYFRFDGFTTTPVSREWTVVELENPWLKVAIYPEIGGKIWNIIDKATGRSIVYDNHVVKFRDVAMRGPWTSGGIEANYGIIGHTPTVASPVDYVTRTNADGSVSCIIGALDLLTRTPWRLEITLPADKAYLTTSSFWYNASPLEQPYYTWMNAAAPVSEDLEYIYPGTRALGHDGELAEWPVNREQGKRVAWYRNNDFGGYKSYHVFGTYSDFVGVYYHDADAGTVRYAPHDEKPGKKLWIWGLSRQGMIWEQLLTDADGQYTEIQSGRLFNQTADGSTRTPFKHRGFAPHASERWTEYWFPVRGIGGMVAASPWGALNVRQVAAGTIIAFSAAQAVRDTLIVRLGDRVLRRRALVLQPMQQFVDTLPGAPGNALHVTLGDAKLVYDADSLAGVLDRPVVAPAAFDWTSAYGHYVLGKEHLRARDIMAAGPEFEAALARDPNYLPALSELASLALRAGRAAEAAAFARRALAIDTYDGQANYLYGLAHWRLGHLADAKDGLDLASQSVEYRAAAWSELARLYLSQADVRRAREYATKALDYDRYGMDALQVRAVAARLAGDSAGAAIDLAAIAAIDPLSVVPSAERMLRADDHAVAPEALTSRLRGEMPNETLLELAIWYHTAGQDRDADRVLAAAAGNAELWYWRGWLRSRLGEPDAERWIARAQAATVRLGFPFRPETVEVLQWAGARAPAWQTDYYLALTEWARGDLTAARRLLEGRGVEPEFAPFFGARAQLRLPTDSAGALRDWRHAMALDPSDWRAGRAVVELLLAADSTTVALPLAAQLTRQFPGNPALGTLYPKVLLRAGRLRDAVAWMDRLVVLPAEGSADARNLFREANLLLAVDRLAAGNASGALALVAKAREWPERLGAGKPYPTDVDERLEDWLAALARGPVGRVPAAMAAEPPPIGSDSVSARVIRAWERARR